MLEISLRGFVTFSDSLVLKRLTWVTQFSNILRFSVFLTHSLSHGLQGLLGCTTFAESLSRSRGLHGLHGFKAFWDSLSLSLTHSLSPKSYMILQNSQILSLSVPQFTWFTRFLNILRFSLSHTHTYIHYLTQFTWFTVFCNILIVSVSLVNTHSLSHGLHGLHGFVTFSDSPSLSYIFSYNLKYVPLSLHNFLYFTISM